MKKNWRETTERGSDEWIVRNFWEKNGKWFKWGGGGLVALITGLSSFYTISNDSVGIVTTFGRYTKTAGPGLNFKLPYVQSVEKVQNQAIFSEAFGFRTLKAGVKTEYIDNEAIKSGKVGKGDLYDIIDTEGLKHVGDVEEQAMDVLRDEYRMLSGDLNMADVEWVVQYKIKDPVAYKFNVKNPEKILRDVSEASMRIVAGDASIDEIITTGKSQIEFEVKKRLQDKLDSYGSGLEVTMVQLQSLNPPENVRNSFNEVNEAIQERSAKINNAQELYNKEIPKAKGEAKRLIEEAEGYATERVNKAKGDVARFKEIYAEYRKEPEITRKRMFLEALPEILKNTDKIIYTEDETGLLLKQLNLGGESK